VASMGEAEKCTVFWWESPRKGDRLEDHRGIDRRMGLEWLLRRLAGVENGFTWLRIGTGGGIL
jgi:hypothetical protein